ncbi:MAG: hypothetical protein IAE80_00305, partial [Anaerolinea sp.]|nr:hypothetical protein [Anaerolinea sp.]
MPQFELVSEFQPTGDQPQAISELVDGINAGLHHQVLLGATGTGKSLGKDDPVYVVEQRGDHRRGRLLPIGDLIDGAIDGASDTQLEGDTEILDMMHGKVRYFAQAFDPQTLEVGLYPIKSFVRHATPKAMFFLQTQCGRSATLTGDHNLWVLREGQLRLIRTEEARITDYIPLPESIQTGDEIQSIDVLEELKGQRLFVEAPESILAYTQQADGTRAFSRSLSASGIRHPYGKLNAIRFHKRGRGIAVDMFQTLLRD